MLARDLLGRATGNLVSLLSPEPLAELAEAVWAWAEDRREPVVPNPAYIAPYRSPGKILGIGLNYRAHAGDLGAQAPRTSPASFLKAAHTIVGPGEAIMVPAGIGRVTAEAELAFPDLGQLPVATVHNGQVHPADTLSWMIFSPAELLSFHSHVMPFHPGDILSTGMPGAVQLTAGDTVSCALGGLDLLTNPVVDAV